ncbi:TauD/TfdA family dioxygenase [Streptomyces sp. TRM76323]|uniref:TauD/TfdA family dioxygenase n=1 Tax=Streptomyces tamarix TaxID=3078565 RepID=A0ABU3QQK1_9ACTN|nr:TauD/TfdA family dioxygenase [Streptomyces tamarix]MDT9685040.1 TauD/TfdA family dioxygenase [Streptomyces tamarix]
MTTPSLTLFETHVLPFATGSGRTRAVMERLRTRGIATVEGLGTRAEVLAFARQVMTLVPHPDSDPDGLTTIRDRGAASRRSGLAGLGSGELLAHTERSSLPRPPRLMLLVCQQPAISGGEVLLTDGRALHAFLAEHAPQALAMMVLPGTAFYGDGGGHPSQIFTRHRDARISIRLRQDALAAFSPLITGHLPHLRAAIDALQQRITLDTGQGYLIDNSRWLHARTGFCGDRVCVRALGNPRTRMAPGFPVLAPMVDVALDDVPGGLPTPALSGRTAAVDPSVRRGFAAGTGPSRSVRFRTTGRSAAWPSTSY